MSKYWKEASSVVIAAKISFFKEGSGLTKNGISTCKVGSQNKSADHKTTNERMSDFNYKILALKRSSKNSYMPDSYVFPGGAVDAADSCKDWMNLFDHFELGKDALIRHFTSTVRTDNKINIFECDRKDDMLKTLSLRITAIRETFEESGVLLCKKMYKQDDPSKWASYLSGNEIQKWQDKVLNNANEFINLCRHFECYPDVCSLQEWSNWLTPSSFPKRFNTAFFLVTLDQMPPAFSNSGEINEFKWSTPKELLDLCSDQQILIPPPQFYELSRLINFNNIEQLADFALKKNTIPSELWMPIRIQASDGDITLFPGDEMYPDEPNFISTPGQKVKDTVLELRKQCHQLHRMEHTKTYNTRLVSNIKKQNHILPWVAPF